MVKLLERSFFKKDLATRAESRKTKTVSQEVPNECKIKPNQFA
jgi:hypothetical protein